MRIGNRLILHTVLVTVFSIVITSSIVGWMAYHVGRKAIEQAATQHLISTRETKKEEIERYLKTIQNQITIFANDLMLVQAMNDFKTAYKIYKQESTLGKKGGYSAEKVRSFLNQFVQQFQKENGLNQSVNTANLLNFSNESSFLLQYNYIIENPYPLDKKYLLDFVDDGTQYSQFHKKYHPLLREYLEKFGYYDIFLIDSVTEEVVYSVFKEVDFASSLKGGVSSNTGLSSVFKKANVSSNLSSKKTSVYMTDFSPYLASYNEKTAFISAPIYKDNIQIGVLVFQFPIDIINEIMTYDKHWVDVGLGKTGETYLVGSDYTLRSMSRFFIEHPTEYIAIMKNMGLPESVINMMQDEKTNIGLQPVRTPGVKKVFEEKKPGVSIFPNYRDVLVLSAYTPLNISELNWALMSEMDVSEAYESVKKIKNQLIWITIIVAFVGIFIAIVMGSRLNAKISNPISELNTRIKRISNDMDLTQTLPVNGKDEISEMKISLNQLIETFRKTLQETIASAKKVQKTSKKLRDLSASTGLSRAEQIQTITTAEKDLQDLTTKMQSLSSQFKILEEQTLEEEDW